jgi:uncharacterized protein (DUF1697 family)
MSRYAAFLRGINVGGHRVSKDGLRAPFVALGFRDVDTFRASGNVVFAADDEPPGELAARIEDGLAEALGYNVATFLRTGSEIRAIAARQPFAPAHMEASGGKLQVAMLSVRPSAQARKSVLALATDSDRLAFGERELYWLPSGGMLESALDLKSIETLLGTQTRRTKNTVEQLCSRHFAGSLP